jgi:rhodanese-related sulfurtransferase
MTSIDPIAQIDPSAAKALAEDGALLLDVREPDEWRAEHIADVVHMPLGELQPDSVPHDRVVVAVCRSGNRSGKAATQLAAAGVDVRNLAGGMKAWAEHGLPITTDDALRARSADAVPGGSTRPGDGPGHRRARRRGRGADRPAAGLRPRAHRAERHHHQQHHHRRHHRPLRHPRPGSAAT